MTITALSEIPASDDGTETTHYRTTVPESVVEVLALEGRRVKWRVTDAGTVELQAVQEE